MFTRKPPKFLYHGTTSHYVDSIKKDGLILGRPFLLSKPVLFFANSRERAKGYAFMRRHMPGFAPKKFHRRFSFKGDGIPIILRVRTSDLNADALRPDWWWKLLGEWGQWRYYQDVPADVIEVEELPVVRLNRYTVAVWTYYGGVFGVVIFLVLYAAGIV